eukprot:Amastigsp_a349893_14.p2 type:complete len:140 gc:universal Amastigsp_a349893_14:441-22(-)
MKVSRTKERQAHRPHGMRGGKLLRDLARLLELNQRKLVEALSLVHRAQREHGENIEERHRVVLVQEREPFAPRPEKGLNRKLVLARVEIVQRSLEEIPQLLVRRRWRQKHLFDEARSGCGNGRLRHVLIEGDTGVGPKK